MDALGHYQWNWKAWRSSWRVQRMTYVDRGLYRELLDEQWKMGILPAAMADLADICGCPVSVMEDSWNRLRFHFPERDGGFSNPTMEAMRSAVDCKRLANAKNGLAGASKKLANARNKQAFVQRSSANAKQTPDERHTPCKLAIESYCKFKGVLFAWNVDAAKQLDILLKSAPALTVATFQACLNNRAKSAGVPHGDHPRVWIPHILRYQEGPLNEFGKTAAPKPEATIGIDRAPKMTEEEIEETRQRINAKKAGHHF